MKKQSKQILSLIMSLIMIISMFTGLEISSVAEDDILEYLSYEINNGEVTITDCDSSISGDIVIPDTIEGYPVTVIGDDAFFYCYKLTSITIPDSVTTIDDYAFCECEGLTSITIPDSVTTIGDYAFCDCEGLTNITIGDSVTTIGDCAFYECEGLTSITIPDSVTTIGIKAFESCYNLKNVIIGKHVTTIGEDAFNSCGKTLNIYYNGNKSDFEKIEVESWNKNTYFHYGITDYENHYVAVEVVDVVCGESDGYTIYHCSCGNEYHDDYVIDYGHVFMYQDRPSFDCRENGYAVAICGNCGYSYKMYEYPGECTAAVDSIYCQFCEKTILNYEIVDEEAIITSVNIGIYGLRGNIVIPEKIDGYTVTAIDDNAFDFCTEIKSITIPSTVRSISETFETNYNLESIIVDENNNYYSNDKDGVLFNKDKTKLIQYPKGSNRTEYRIPDSVKIIGTSAFEQSKLENIIIPDSVTSIENFAFIVCENLKYITIGDGVTKIGTSAFYSCGDLESIIIGNSVETIGENAFCSCFSLEHVTIPASVTTIEHWAFGYTLEGIQEGFEIYGLSGTAAEKYAKENSITFIAIEPETQAPTTEKPTDKPTEKPVSDKLEVKDDTVKVDNTSKVSTVKTKSSANDILKSVKNEKVSIVDKDGKAVSGDALVGTGAKIQIKDNNGKVINTYTVCVPTDVDGNGKTTAADARLALRASAKLDKVEGVYATASDMNTDGKITAADARKILRISAGLEKA